MPMYGVGLLIGSTINADKYFHCVTLLPHRAPIGRPMLLAEVKRSAPRNRAALFARPSGLRESSRSCTNARTT
jgi:hypothetical protein